MSIRVMTNVWECSHLRDQSQLLVMLALADFANEQGESFPSVPTLAEKSRVSERHVQKVIAHLQAHKLITVEKGAGKGRMPGQRSNLFRINVAKLLGNDPIPSPDYEKLNRKKGDPRHNATGTPGTMPPLPVACAQKTGGTMPPKPSEEETSKETTTTPRAHAYAKAMRPVAEQREEVVVVSSGVVVEEEEKKLSKKDVGLSLPNDDPQTPESLPEENDTTVTSFSDTYEQAVAAATDTIDALGAEFGLNAKQLGELGVYEKRNGMAYVEEKVAITRAAPRNNAAAFFVKALEEDWQPPKTNVKPRPVTYSQPEEWAGVLRRLYPDADHEAYSSWSRLPQSLQEEVYRAIDDNPSLVDELKAERKVEAQRQSAQRERLKQTWLAASAEQQQRWLSVMPEISREFRPKAGSEPGFVFLSALEQVLDAPEASPMEAAA